MSNELISLTGLAKLHHTTTPIMRKKLEEHGVRPTQSAEMPSGRTFLVFNKDVALAALERAKKAKEAAQAAAQEAEKAKKAEASTPAHTPPAEDVDVVKMAADLAEVKEYMRQLIDMMTKPTTNKEGT